MANAIKNFHFDYRHPSLSDTSNSSDAVRQVHLRPDIRVISEFFRILTISWACEWAISSGLQQILWVNQCLNIPQFPCIVCILYCICNTHIGVRYRSLCTYIFFVHNTLVHTILTVDCHNVIKIRTTWWLQIKRDVYFNQLNVTAHFFSNSLTLRMNEEAQSGRTSVLKA